MDISRECDICTNQGRLGRFWNVLHVGYAGKQDQIDKMVNMVSVFQRWEV